MGPLAPTRPDSWGGGAPPSGDLARRSVRRCHQRSFRAQVVTELRDQDDLSLAELGERLGLSKARAADIVRDMSQARVSKIEHGEISGIDVVRAYVSALGGSIDVVAHIGDRSWKVA